MELALAVPEVLAHRLTRLANAGPAPSSRDRREFSRMGSEKIACFYESWNGMVMAMVEANLRFAFHMASRPWMLAEQAPHVVTEHVSRTAMAMLGRGLDPIHRRAVANATRLRRRR